MRHGSLLILILLLVSCGNGHRRNDEKPIARAYNNYLYPSDLTGLVSEGMSPEDSTALIKSHIELWLKRKAVVNKAEFNLTMAQRDLAQKIEEYRSSLLIYEYEKLMVAQKLDTIVRESEISGYYSQYRQNFQLQVPIVKGVYFRIPKSSARLREFKDLAHSAGELAFKRLVDLGAQQAEYTESFEENWLSFNSLMQKIPGNVEDPKQFLQRYRYLEAEDDRYFHYVRIIDYMLPGEVSPPEYVRQEIIDILLNKRKMKFLKELEESIYNESVIHNEVEVYEN
jgi:hypothetical protein